jgi:hypothetical protein
MKALAAFVAVRARAFTAGQEVRLGCAAREALIKARLVAEANVRKAYAAGLAVIFGATKGFW